jgi:hypothetical protein
LLNAVTVANSGGTGLFVGEDNVTLMNAVAVNTTNVGLNTNPGDGMTVVNLAAVHTGQTSFLSRQSNSLLQGFIIVGDNRSLYPCDVQSATNAGITYPNCESDLSAGAQFTPLLDQNLSAAFVGRLGANDASNGTTQTNGTAAYDSITDWHTFQYPTRMWGTGVADAFPSATLQEVCETGETCAIWDWALSTADSPIKGTNMLPGAEDFVVHTWVAADAGACAKIDGAVWSDPDCTTTFLKHAVELVFDHVGNDNSLCESGETCLFTPNMGYYQGHGSLNGAGNIGAGGTIENVTRMQYESNGR